MRTFLLKIALLTILLMPCVAGAETETLRLVVLGDSLTAGYGLASEEAFPARLEKALREQGCKVHVINAGVSGDTSAGGLARLEWSLADEPHFVLVNLGGNDTLRGLDPAHTRANLDAILSRLRERGVQPILAGMRAPRNLGSDYYIPFDALYPSLAEEHGVPFYPFFLDGVAGVPELNLPDGIHPNAQGIDEIVRRILPVVKEALARKKTEMGEGL
ncbi:arylesterase [Geoalkalibacter halelectricus]|uniref:Arylesterase n=1 Tax=Geoalkalibacter halelectricus TaxID=2847045 RepID=A0ABY5ZNF3_9BACT|nr:arylesterase [Geoalkalibacter halelectricus]MDO3377575.1 arylesterase [Geoalkalibacter halelectricus]UWZ80667.1 arylesterase [Geoalkalibacter halelectricus]